MIMLLDSDVELLVLTLADLDRDGYMPSELRSRVRTLMERLALARRGYPDARRSGDGSAGGKAKADTKA